MPVAPQFRGVHGQALPYCRQVDRLACTTHHCGCWVAGASSQRACLWLSVPNSAAFTGKRARIAVGLAAFLVPRMQLLGVATTAEGDRTCPRTKKHKLPLNSLHTTPLHLLLIACVGLPKEMLSA